MTTQTTWSHFAEMVGFANLIPIAPEGEPSPNSKLKQSQIGKIPSLYTPQGVIGFKQWSTNKATAADVSKWSKDARYSIGLILARDNLYAIDCDLTDEVQHEIIYNLLVATVGCAFAPYRGRSNSNRRLYIVRVDSDPLAKRVLKLTDGNAVEFLGDGQQCVIAGRHPSGAEYSWWGDPLLGGEELPAAFPALAHDTFLQMWDKLRTLLPVDIATVAGIGRKRELVKGQELITDETAQWLDDNGVTISIGYQSERYLDSPRKHLYSSEASDTSLAYFPAGTGGFEQGHFKSMHSSDADLTDADWLDIFGLRDAEFEVIEDEPNAPGPLPALKRDRKGMVEATTPNLLAALRDKRCCDFEFKYDEFKQVVLANGDILQDEVYVMIMERLEGTMKFKSLTAKRIAECARLVAKENSFDSLIQWCKTLKWDGVPRAEDFFIRMWDVEDTPYIRAVGKYLWSQIAGRAMVPGIQADLTVLMISSQGKAKSQGIRAMVPDINWFDELDFELSVTERSKRLRGRCLIELGELTGMSKREIGEVRSFMSATHDTARRLYAENSDTFPRRCVFIGTSNDDEPLTDSAGNRRWLPFTIPDTTKPDGIADRIRAERDQLWAEGIAMFLKGGVHWQDAETLARNVTPEYESEDATLVNAVRDWFNRVTDDIVDETARNKDLPFVTTAHIIADMELTKGRKSERSVQMDLGKMLKKKGYVKTRYQEDGLRIVRWYRRDCAGGTPK